eukprot:365195-Chlamydomonas_euryale.AAC.1
MSACGELRSKTCKLWVCNAAAGPPWATCNAAAGPPWATRNVAAGPPWPTCNAAVGQPQAVCYRHVAQLADLSAPSAMSVSAMACRCCRLQGLLKEDVKKLYVFQYSAWQKQPE